MRAIMAPVVMTCQKNSVLGTFFRAQYRFEMAVSASKDGSQRVCRKLSEEVPVDVGIVKER